MTTMSFTVPMTPFAAMAERNGYRKETVRGRVHYTSTDDLGRAVVGPRSHRATRNRVITPQETRIMKWDTDTSGVNTEPIVEAEVVDEVVHDERPTWRERARRFGQRVINRLKDLEWHDTARHCAVTAFTWVALGSLALVFIKGAIWVMFL